MNKLILLILFISYFSSSLQETIILTPPQNESGTDVAIIMIHGQSCEVQTYQALYEQVQTQGARDGFRVWVGIPQFIFDTPEPVLIDHYVSQTLDQLKKDGFSGDNVFIAGHSLGGVMSQIYVKSNPQYKGLILMGSSLLRTNIKINEEGFSIIDFPVQVLTIGGTKDGLFRVSRNAENFYHTTENIDKSQKGQYRTIVYDGLAHQSFMNSKWITDYVKKNDLKPDMDQQNGYIVISQTISIFLQQTLQDQYNNFDDMISSTKKIVQPFLDGMQLEGSYNMKPPCYSSNLVNQDSKTCQSGSQWSQQAQKIMGGDINSKINTDDNFHRVYTIVPVHLPQINNTCSSQDCTLETITVTENIYTTLNYFDTGLYPIAATEMKIKMMSRQSIQIKSGNSNADFHNEDEVGNRCGEINQESLNWALSQASESALDNYNKFGSKLVIGDDLGPYNAGPLWIWHYLTFTTNGDQTILQSPMMRTPTDYLISSAAGFHYCKVLSPYRALEWIYIDSLYGRNPN